MKTKFEKPSFVVRSYNKGQLARLYLPKRPYRSLIRRFNEWMRESPELIAALEALGADMNTRQFTPKQVEVIVKHLGEPEYKIDF